MSDDDDEALRLNTLHRFRKHSPRLLLEEYSHCEVPAGCGGVVLRWVDPQAGTPAVVRTFVEGQVTTWLDGELVESGRVYLSAGTHLLALELTDLEAPKVSRLATMLGRERPAVLLLSIVRALGRDADHEDAVVLLRSRARPSWRLSGERPPEAWTAPEFDDAGWAVPQAVQLDRELASSWRVQQLQQHGAQPLGLPAKHAWMRVRFEVPALRVAPPSGSDT